MSEQPGVYELDVETGIEVIREATEEELAERASIDAANKTQEEARIASRESALAKLAALGLTEEEIAAL
jgi:DNA-binding NarL/FixJ family response regulator